MTKEQIRNSLKSGELKLNKSQLFTHYSMVIFFLMPPSVFIYMYLDNYIDGTDKSLPTIAGFLFTIVPIGLALVLYKLQKSRLKFKTIETNLNREKIKNIIQNIAEKLEWLPYQIDENIIIAKTFPSFLSGSWGEQITILFENNKILVNSICDPDKQSSVVSFGRNKINVETLINEINKNSR